MNLRQLEILCAVMRCRTTIAAAYELGMSQPAVSNAIKSLEQHAGFPLFERINNRLFPTAEAQLLYDDAEPLFSIRNSLEAKMQDLREVQAGHLRLLATPPLGYGAAPLALRRFLASRPKVKVFFDVRRFEHVVESVENRIVDLGLVLGYDEQPDLESQIVLSGEMVCVFRADHPLASKDAITPADLTGTPFIALERGSRLGALERQAFAQVNCPFNFSVEVRYCQTACVLADNGVGAAIVDPFSAAFGTWRELVSRPFTPALRVAAHAIWLKGRPLARLAGTFLREMRVAAAEAGYCGWGSGDDGSAAGASPAKQRSTAR